MQRCLFTTKVNIWHVMNNKRGVEDEVSECRRVGVSQRRQANVPVKARRPVRAGLGQSHGARCTACRNIPSRASAPPDDALCSLFWNGLERYGARRGGPGSHSGLTDDRRPTADPGPTTPRCGPDCTHAIVWPCGVQ